MVQSLRFTPEGKPTKSNRQHPTRQAQEIKQDARRQQGRSSHWDQRPLVTTLHADDVLHVSSQLEVPRCAQVQTAQLMHVD